MLLFTLVRLQNISMKKNGVFPFVRLPQPIVFTPLKGIPPQEDTTIVFTCIPLPGNTIAGQPLEHQQIPVILSQLLLLIYHPEERGVPVLEFQASAHMWLL